jgi:uncharacterized protein YbjT (DUF2867 family)
MRPARRLRGRRRRLLLGAFDERLAAVCRARPRCGRTFRQVCSRRRRWRIVYLGGLGADDATLSHHLASRHEVGAVLRASGVEIIEFRAAVIIGAGSVSFEMMRYLTERLPVMIAPRWVTTRSQPIAVNDVLRYLVAALDLPRGDSRIYEIGGADVVTYRDMMLRYARLRNLKRTIVIVPFFTPRLSSYWVHLVTPVPARLAQPLILGLHNEVIVRDSARGAISRRSSRSTSRPRSPMRWIVTVPAAPRRRGSMRSTFAGFRPRSRARATAC